MDVILNYIFIGFVFTFLIDYISDKFKNHPAFQGVPEWTWGARIALTLFWPLGVIIFIYTFLKSYTKQ